MKIYIPKIEIVRTDYSKQNVVPKKYDEFLTDMNYTCTSGINVFEGRKKEVNMIFNTFLKSYNSNVVLLGEHGVGKSATVNAAVYSIMEKKCPKELRNLHFIYWDIEKILALATSEDPKIGKMIAKSFEFITSYTNLVVVIDQLHLIQQSTLLRYYFYILLKTSGVKVLGLTTEEDFHTYFAYDKKSMSLLEFIRIEEPKKSKIYPMLCKHIEVLEKIHDMKISEELVNYIISVSDAFPSYRGNPGLTLNLVEKSMIFAKRKNRSQVTKKDINKNFNFDYEKFNRFSDKDKLTIAYHEAGHFLVGRLSENIRNLKTNAITIVPGEDFLGITIFDEELFEYGQPLKDRKYYIDFIAMALGGRAGEIVLLGEGRENEYSSGAYEDLIDATEQARRIITEFGMENSASNMTYFPNYDFTDMALLSEETKTNIDKSVKELTNQAMQRALKLLSDNKELLNEIANALITNEILDEYDLEKLCEDVAKE